MNKLLLALNRFSGIDIEALLQKQQDLDREVASLKQQLAAGEEEKTALTEDYEKRLADLELQIQQLDTQTADLLVKMGEKDAHVAEMFQMKQAVSANLNQVQEANQLLNERNQKLNECNQSLQARNRSLNDSFGILQKEYGDLVSQKDDLQQHLETLQHTEETHLKEMDDLSAAHASLQKEYQELQTEQSRLTDELKKLEEQLQQAKTALDDSKKQFLEERTGWTEKCAGWEEKYQHLEKLYQTEREADQKKISEQQGSLQQVQQQNAALEQVKKDHEAELTQKKKQLADLESKIKQQETQMQDFLTLQQKQKDQYDTNKSQLQHQKEQLQHQTEQLQQKYDGLQQERSQLQQQKEQLQQQNSQLQQKYDGLQQEHSQLQQQNNQLQHQNSQLQQQYDGLQQEHSQLQQQQEQLQQQNSQLQQKFQDQEKQLKTVTEQWVQAKSLLDQANHEEKDGELQRSSLNQKLIEAQAEIDALHQKFAQMETERVALMHELTELRQKKGVASSAASATPVTEHTSSSEPVSAKPSSSVVEPVSCQMKPAEMQSHDGIWIVRYPAFPKLAYQGLFQGHTQEHDGESYPYTMEPLYHTEVACWTEQKELPASFAGRLLEKGMRVLDRLEAGIRISSRASLPVTGADWGFHPDLLIEWPEYQLCVAVCVDAPYDFQTGKPCHSIDAESDAWMNYYLMNQGACVVHVAEEQLIEDYEQVLAFLSNYLYEQTGDDRLMQQVSWGVSTPLWSVENARVAADHHYREQYLGRDFLRELLAVEKSVTPDTADRLPLSWEQLPAEAVKLRDFKQAASDPFLVVRTRPYGSEVVFAQGRVACQGFWIKGMDLVKEEMVTLPLCAVECITGRKQLYKQYEMESRGGRIAMEQLQAIVADAVCQYHPVVVEYRMGDGRIQQTPLYWLTFAPTEQSSVELPYGGLFQDMVRDAINPEQILGMSPVRQCAVRLSLRDIVRIKVLDVFVTEKEGIGALINGIYCAVLYQQESLAEMLYAHLSEEIRALPYTQANYAHLCMLKQDYKKARDIYTSIPPQRLIEGNVSWEELVRHDFTELIQNDVEPQAFIRMAHELNRAGWHFE